LKNSTKICEKYNDLFRTIVADTPKLREEAYKLRFNVYCEELQYEPTTSFPDKMERDSYDDRSIHCLVQHRQSGEYAGCIRFITHDWRRHSAMFPCEIAFQESGGIDILKRGRFQFAEVSRLAVKSKFRNRMEPSPNSRNPSCFEKSQYQSKKQVQLPLVTLCLYVLTVSMLKILDYRSICMMESRLARHLKRCGLPTTQIGDFVDYRGKRAPFLLDPDEILPNWPAETLELFESIHGQLSQSAYILDYRKMLSEALEYPVCA
jgi:N-acyl amino acid synthase of PEP-CTERM/exosortase system